MSSETAASAALREPALRGQTVVVIGPGFVDTPAVHVMSNTALTGATYDVDGGQQPVA